MTILDIRGGKLVLRGRWLQDMREGHFEWKVNLATIEDGKLACLYMDCYDGCSFPIGRTYLRTSFKDRRIGCARFSKTEWSKLMSARKKYYKTSRRTA